MATSNKIEILPEDILTGISAVISINVADPPFNSQAKTKLSGPEIKKAIYETLVKEFNKFIKGMSEEDKKIISDKIVNNAKVRSAAEVAKATKRKSLANKSPANLPSKLKECDLVGDDLAELYICLKGDTKIELASGEVKTIEELEQSLDKEDKFKIHSVNTKTGEYVEAEASDVRITGYQNHLKKITLNDGSVVECTPEHRFMLIDEMKWVEAKDLNFNDPLLSIAISDSNVRYVYDVENEKTIEVEAERFSTTFFKVISVEDVYYEEPIPVYCLTVHNEFHSYALANGLITHNCEGDSAANTIMAARDSSYQAILPLRGKVLNVMKLDLTNKKQRERFNNNAEIDDMIKALGAGVGEQFDLDKIRYGKVVFACFAGDTKVKCLDGNAYTFEELVESNTEELWVYSRDKNGDIKPAKAVNPRLIERNQEVIKLTFDNGSTIVCTPDHKFMMRDGSYKSAEDIKSDESLMPLYMKEDESGYLQYFDDNDQKKPCYKYVHRLVNNVVNTEAKKEAEYRILKEDYSRNSSAHPVTHHKDYNKHNNTPENLDWLTLKEHGNLHFHDGHTITEYNKSEAHKKRVSYLWKETDTYKNATFNANGYNSSEKQRENLKKKHKNGDYAEHYKQLAELNKIYSPKKMTNLNKREDVKKLQQRSKCCKVGRKILDSGFELNEEVFSSRDNRVEMINKLGGGVRVPKIEKILKWFDNFDEYVEACENYNHKVIKIERLTAKQDVYCLTVPEYHNFAIELEDSSGVFVKNCDSDVDGMAICTLLLGIFYRLFRPMIEDGRVYQCCSPLFEIKYKEDGKYKMAYAMNDKERIVIEEDFKKRGIKKYEIMRAKGLGELNADTFHNYVLNPKNRRLIRINIEDAEKASEMLELAIGNKSADDRKSWMLDNTQVIDDLGLYN